MRKRRRYRISEEEGPRQEGVIEEDEKENGLGKYIIA